MKNMFLPVCVIVSLTCSCRTIKPYEKEYLLSPLMDDASFSPLSFDHSERFIATLEKLSQSAGSSSGGSSCPTCGG